MSVPPNGIPEVEVVPTAVEVAEVVEAAMVSEGPAMETGLEKVVVVEAVAEIGEMVRAVKLIGVVVKVRKDAVAVTATRGLGIMGTPEGLFTPDYMTRNIPMVIAELKLADDQRSVIEELFNVYDVSFREARSRHCEQAPRMRASRTSRIPKSRKAYSRFECRCAR